MMTFIQTAAIFVIIYLGVYAIIDRICRCIESCNISKTYRKTIEKKEEHKNDN